MQEVCMMRFTAIVFNYSEGKRDLLRALEFVFGANLKEVQADSPKELLHRVLWKEFDNENSVPCYVEVSVESLSKKELITFYRGVTNRGIEHKIDGKLVSNLDYKDKLVVLNLCINEKNVIFSKNLFYKTIWGDPEDLEKAVTKILRANYSVDQLKKTKEKLTYFEEVEKLLSNTNFKSMKKSHGTIEKFVRMFNTIATQLKYSEDLINIESVLEEESSLSGSPESKSDTSEKTVYEELLRDMIALETERDLLLHKYRLFEKREKLLCSELFYNTIKMSSKPGNICVLQEQIIKLKRKFKAQENCLPSLWIKMEEKESELKDLERKISNDLGHLWDLQQSSYLKNRITLYGRFMDYLQRNNFVTMLRKILGEEIIYANLCDDMPTAIFFSNLLKKRKYPKREHFLIFKDYSPNLKDLLLASGEEGIKINNIQALQIFLCKLKQYKLISSVPIIIGRRFNFKLEEGKNYDEDIMYPHDGIFLKSDGLIVYTPDHKVNLETEDSILDRVNSLLIQQELKYEEYCDLFFTRFETLRNMSDLENDIFYLKSGVKRVPSRFAETLEKQVPHEHEQHDEGIHKQLEESYYLSTRDGTQSLTVDQANQEVEKLLPSISAVLDETESEKIKTKNELAEVEKKLKFLYIISNAIPIQPVIKFPPFNQPKLSSHFYYEKQLENLTSFMSKNEVEEFENWKDWRIQVIQSVIEDTTANVPLKAVLERLTTSRKKVLSPLLEHCSLYLTETLNLMMDTSLPFLDLAMNQPEDRLQLLTSSSENLFKFIDISNLNTFLKYIAALSLFLEIAVYDKIPVLFFDDMEEFLPCDFETVISENTLRRVVAIEGNNHFQILMRMAQFFEFFIKKNTTENTTMKNRNDTGIYGPIQIIYFTNGDLVHFAEHQLWIQSKLLTDEYVTDDCSMYSFLQEIDFGSAADNTSL